MSQFIDLEFPAIRFCVKIYNSAIDKPSSLIRLSIILTIQNIIMYVNAINTSLLNEHKINNINIEHKINIDHPNIYDYWWSILIGLRKK